MMQFYVNNIEFDFEDSQGELPFDEQIELINSIIGVWEADSEDDLIEIITDGAGWCIKSIDYEHQLK